MKKVFVSIILLMFLTACGVQPINITRTVEPTKTRELTLSATPIPTLTDTNTPTPIPPSSTATIEPADPLPTTIPSITPEPEPVERKLSNFCSDLHDIGENYQLIYVGNICDQLTPEMTRPLEDPEVNRLTWADGLGVEDGFIPELHYYIDRGEGEYSVRDGIACIIKGFIPYPYIDGPNTILSYCEIRINEYESQGVWFVVPDTDLGIAVRWLDDGVMQRSLDDFEERPAYVPMNQLVELFKRPEVFGQQIMVMFLSDSNYMPTEKVRDPYLALQNAIGKGEGLYWENAWPMQAQAFYLDEDLKEFMP